MSALVAYGSSDEDDAGNGQSHDRPVAEVRLH